MRTEVQVLPKGFLERLRKIIPSNKFDTVANSFSESKPTTFRINRLKLKEKGTGLDSRPVPVFLKEELESQGFRLEPVSWYPDAFIMIAGNNRDRSLRMLQETDLYKTGEIYVQNLSSMIPPIILDPKPGEFVLDLAAAPGSKTTQIASMMCGEGKMVACDNNRIRFFKLKANLEMQGAKSVETLLCYGETIGKKYPDHFDKVLLDAPCSSEGRFNVKEPASFGYWKPSKVYEMAKKQKKLIFSAIMALKPGGTLVYSTCTFAPEENEAVLNWAVRKFEGLIEIETIQLPIPNQMSGLASWEGENFNPSVRRAVRVVPNASMEAFFVACLRKTRS